MRSRTLMAGVLAVAAALGAATWTVTRPPRWQAWPGETSVSVQVDGAAPPPDRVWLRGDKGAGERGSLQGDRLKFAGLAPDTTYTLEWRVGPLTTATLPIATLPSVLPALDLEVTPAPGRLALKVRMRDQRLGGIEMQVASGGQALPRTGDRIEIPLPAARDATDLELVLPASQERYPLDLPVLGIDRLLDELARIEAEVEVHLAPPPGKHENDDPALLSPAALEPWEPSPMPARRLAATGGAAVLAKMRRFAPLVRAAVASDAPLEKRWRLAFAATRLAGAEVLARRHQQPALGVLDWAHDLVRFAPAKLTMQARRGNLVAHPAHVAHPEYARTGISNIVEVVGGTPDSRLVQLLELPPLPASRAAAWCGVTVVLQAVTNSGSLVLRYPNAGAAVELPLLQPFGVTRNAAFARTFPLSILDVWVRRVPPEADWSTLVLEPTHRPKSNRVSPTFVALVAPLDRAPPER